MIPKFLEAADGRRIAYHHTEGSGPTVVFLGGFRSDMSGTKALFLEDWARKKGIGFLRFDYTGHGASSGKFEEGSIGDWARDAEETINQLTSGSRILVGSSMGGWISLLVASRLGTSIAAIVGIAAAPDFTEDAMVANFTNQQRVDLEALGHVDVPSDYSDEPYRITRRLIEDGRNNLVLRTPLQLPFPVRLLHGSEDHDVPLSVALRLLDHATGPDLRLTIVKGADHRFSEPENLALLADTLESLLTDCPPGKQG